MYGRSPINRERLTATASARCCLAAGGAVKSSKSAPRQDESLDTIEYPDEDINPEDIPF